MGLSKKFLEDEIAKGKQAIESFKEGIEVHKVVVAAFERELKKCNSKESNVKSAENSEE